MRMRLERRGEIYLPLALLIPAALGRAAGVLLLLAAYLLARLATLCASEAFCAAAAGEISARRVRGQAATALLATVFLGTAAWRFGPAPIAWLFAGPVDGKQWNLLCGAGVLMALSRLNIGFLRAGGQEGSAEMCEFLAALAIAASLLMGGPIWWLGAAAFGALLSAAIAVAVGGWPFGLPRAKVLFNLPGAALRHLLYPLPGLLLTAGFLRAKAPFALEGYLLGLAAFGLTASPFRRTEGESPSLHLLLIAPAAALSIAAAFVPPLRAPSMLLAFAALCAMVRSAAPTWRAAAMSALLVAAFSPMPWMAAPAIPLLWPDARLARLRRRRKR